MFNITDKDGNEYKSGVGLPVGLPLSDHMGMDVPTMQSLYGNKFISGIIEENEKSLRLLKQNRPVTKKWNYKQIAGLFANELVHILSKEKTGEWSDGRYYYLEPPINQPTEYIWGHDGSKILYSWQMNFNENRSYKKLSAVNHIMQAIFYEGKLFWNRKKN